MQFVVVKNPNKTFTKEMALAKNVPATKPSSNWERGRRCFTYREKIFCNWPNSGGMLPERLFIDISLQLKISITQLKINIERWCLIWLRQQILLHKPKTHMISILLRLPNSTGRDPSRWLLLKFLNANIDHEHYHQISKKFKILDAETLKWNWGGNFYCRLTGWEGVPSHQLKLEQVQRNYCERGHWKE